jgi:hypothetical protein
MSAASVAAFPGELAGEEAALAAFQAVTHTELVPSGGRASMIKTIVVSKLLTLKAAAVAAAAVLSVGGVALAASTDVLPDPFSPRGPASTPAATLASNHSNGPHATQSPSLVGLCKAYRAGAAEANEHVLANPAFAALVEAAGGRENVASFCYELVPATPSRRGGRPTDVPRHDPSQLPTPSHPTGKPPPTPSHP